MTWLWCGRALLTQRARFANLVKAIGVRAGQDNKVLILFPFLYRSCSFCSYPCQAIGSKPTITILYSTASVSVCWSRLYGQHNFVITSTTSLSPSLPYFGYTPSFIVAIRLIYTLCRMKQIQVKKQAIIIIVEDLNRIWTVTYLNACLFALVYIFDGDVLLWKNQDCYPAYNRSSPVVVTGPLIYQE